jgi:multicomponent Na+:H+ antiporter subunit F
MNPWLLSATALVFILIPVAIRCFRGDPMDRLIALEAAGALVSMTLLLLTVGFQRIALIDISLSAALLTFAGGLVFARFLERWL